MQPAFGTIRVFDDPDAQARGVAEWFCETASGADRFVVSLSGGSTPKRLYETLASAPFRDRVPWQRVIVTFGDERFVPPDDPASNYRMAREALIDRVPLPPGNVHPFATTGVTPEQSAAAYEATLRGLARDDGPLFDLTFLGVGDDGHTASLIPGEPVLDEKDRWVAPVPHGRDTVRLTLTYPALANSRRVAFLANGAGKCGILDRIFSGDTTLPAARVRPKGEVLWFVDRAAAGRWAE